MASVRFGHVLVSKHFGSGCTMCGTLAISILSLPGAEVFRPSALPLWFAVGGFVSYPSMFTLKKCHANGNRPVVYCLRVTVSLGSDNYDWRKCSARGHDNPQLQLQQPICVCTYIGTYYVFILQQRSVLQQSSAFMLILRLSEARHQEC